MIQQRTDTRQKNAPYYTVESRGEGESRVFESVCLSRGRQRRARNGAKRHQNTARRPVRSAMAGNVRRRGSRRRWG